MNQEPNPGAPPTSASKQGEVNGRLCPSGERIRLAWEQGRISRLDPSEADGGADFWIAPPLFDLQVNGYGGVDFQRDGLTTGDLLSAARHLRAAGCARFLVTLISDDWSALTSRLRHLRWARAQSAELRRAIAGWHVEGPFLSGEPGFCGAHNPLLLCNPTAEHILELRTITEGDPVLLTLAPERPGALGAISLARSLGMHVSLGHTNAPAEILKQAIALGATGFTHLGNGCPRELQRDDNILWRVLDTPGLSVSLIPDEIHVSPSLFRLFHWVIGPDSIFYISDAMSAAGMPPGVYTLGRQELQVGADQVVRLPGRTNFAGSALRPIDGVFRAARMLGRPWQEAWPRFSEAPARFLGLGNTLEVGSPAEFCLLRVASDDQLLEIQTYVADCV